MSNLSYDINNMLLSQVVVIMKIIKEEECVWEREDIYGKIGMI